MADFDPQQSAENEANNNKPQSQGDCGQPSSREWDYSCDARRDETDLGSSDAYRSSSFVSDWSGAEHSLAQQAESFEARRAEMDQPKQPERFWLDLVKSQESTPATASTGAADATPQQAERLWPDLVSSQFSPPSETSESTPSEYVSSHKPTGMGWADEEATEWAPPEREADYTRSPEPVEAAAEQYETETTAQARRDDVQWSEPASAQDEFASTRSEALSAEPQRTLMDAAVEAAQSQPTKARAPRKAAAKKPAKAKKTVAKKPAKKTAAKKTAAKKAMKKTPAPKIVKDPTRRAA